jgi:hypothetical protein
MGLPFASGHYLALRRFPASSVGPAYTAVWWRDPQGRWVIYADVAPMLSCARYYGCALERAEQRAIDLRWTGERSLRVSITGVLEWQIELGSTLATRMLSVVASRMPIWLWRSAIGLIGAGLLAGTLLRTGRLRLRGTVPNGQWFRANPRRAWVVTASRATVGGEDAGPTGPLETQTGLGDFWLPQRGVFFMGESYFEATRRTVACSSISPCTGSGTSAGCRDAAHPLSARAARSTSADTQARLLLARSGRKAAAALTA